MEHLFELGLFAGKALLTLIVIAATIVLFFAMAIKNKPAREYLEVEKLNEKYDNFKDLLQSVLLTKKQQKKADKEEKKSDKSKKSDDLTKGTVFVIEFKGDIMASNVEHLRDEVSAILTIAKPTDVVLAKVESPGGAVYGYGLAASQLNRVRQAGIELVVAVDKVAASGGYMMACVANKILCAPFAIVGSIGVVAQVPNFHKLLKKNDVDYEEYTSGEYKRTVSLLGEITEKGKKKFNEQIEETHVLFKGFVSEYRPNIDIAKVATGEYWYGKQALALGLIDEIKTSDEYLFDKRENSNLVKVKIQERKKLKDLLGEAARSVTKTLERFQFF